MALVSMVPGVFTAPGLPVLGEGGGFVDTFSRPDSTSLGATEGIPSRPWAVWVQSGTASQGITNGEGWAYRDGTAGHTLATVDAGASDGTLTVTMGTGAGATVGPAFRCADVSNFYRLVNFQGVDYRLHRFVGGSLTRLDTDLGVTPAAGDVVEAVLSGPSIIVRINGVQVGAFTDSTHQAATRHGFYNNVQGSTIRDVRFATA